MRCSNDSLLQRGWTGADQTVSETMSMLMAFFCPMLLALLTMRASRRTFWTSNCADVLCLATRSMNGVCLACSEHVSFRDPSLRQVFPRVL